MIQIVGVHFVGSITTRHIESLRWVQVATPGGPAQSAVTQSTREQMVDFVRQSPEQAFALNAAGTEYSYLVAVNGNPPYVRTAPDDTPSDNLLALPRY